MSMEVLRFLHKMHLGVQDYANEGRGIPETLHIKILSK